MAEQDLDLDEGLEVEASTGEPTSTTRQEEGRQSTNWQNDPEYKKQQAKRDRELAAAQKAAYEASQAAARMQAQMEQLSMRGLEGEELLAAQNNLLQQRLAEVQRQRDLDAYAMQRARDLQDIVTETGVPLDQIEDAPNVHVAWQIGQRYAKEQAQKRNKPLSREEEIERVADDRVDFAAPKARTKSSTLQAKYDEARKKYDIRGQLEAMAEADMKGVAINEW